MGDWTSNADNHFYAESPRKSVFMGVRHFLLWILGVELAKLLLDCPLTLG